MREPKLEIVINGTRVTVDLDKLDQQMVEDLTEKVAAIRRKHSIYAKYPFEENETRDQWAERVSKLAQEEFIRQEGESPEDHMARMFESKSDIHKMVPEIFNAVCETFGLKQHSTEDLKKLNWIKQKRFLYDVLTACDIHAEDIRPVVPGK